MKVPLTSIMMMPSFSTTVIKPSPYIVRSRLKDVNRPIKPKSNRNAMAKQRNLFIT